MSLSPKLTFSKISLHTKQKPLRVVVLGQCGVGKSALVVRFVTNRFIGEYDPDLEKVYSYQSTVEEEMVSFEILDTARHDKDKEFLALEMNIKWGDVFILVYSVTDKCSFDECNHLKFMINYIKNKKKRVSHKDTAVDVPVVLVGNKNDQQGERMISFEDGLKRSQEIGCFCFHEISARESIAEVNSVFLDIWKFWKVHSKLPKLKRSESDIHTSNLSMWTRYADMRGIKSKYENRKEDEEGSTSLLSSLEADELRDVLPPFRERASTDGTLHLHKHRHNFHVSPMVRNMTPNRQRDRRMSISMRGNNNMTY